MKKIFTSLRAKFLSWLMSTKFYLFFLRMVLPKIHILHNPGPGYSAKQKLRDLMQPGDFLVSKDSYQLTNLIIGGDFSHSAVVVGPDKIAQFTSKDFDVVDANEFCDGVNHFALLRLNDLSGDYAAAIVTESMGMADLRYDPGFTFGIMAMYCSEFSYQSDFEHRMKADITDKVGMGKSYVSPDDIYQARGLSVIFEWTDTQWKKS